MEGFTKQNLENLSLLLQKDLRKIETLKNFVI